MTDKSVVLVTKVRSANMEFFRTHLLPEVCKISNQPQALQYAYWIANARFDFFGCAKEPTAVTHSVENEQCLWAQV